MAETDDGSGGIFEKYYHELIEEIVFDAKVRLKKLIGDKCSAKDKERIIRESETKMWTSMKEYIKKPSKEEERNSWKEYQEGRNMVTVCVQPIMEKAVNEMLSLYADEINRRPPPAPAKEESDDEIDFSDGLWAKKHPAAKKND